MSKKTKQSAPKAPCSVCGEIDRGHTCCPHGCDEHGEILHPSIKKAKQ